jgi:CheY-like chemotaxis protein
VKFTPRGGRISIALERLDSHLEIRVSDTGCGIRAEFLPLIFDRFRQVDSSTTRAFGGLGLGLSIVRQLVELHGGTVTADSAGEGMGTTFVVRLPVTSVHPRVEYTPCKPGPDRRPAMSALSGSLAGISILAIDDEPDSLRVLATALRQFGAEVWGAHSASEGLQVLRAREVSVVICDIGMPQEDGYSFIRKLRELEKSASRWTPAIALTAYARPEDRMRTVAAGFQVHVAKPADPMEIGALVANLARTVIR